MYKPIMIKKSNIWQIHHNLQLVHVKTFSKHFVIIMDTKPSVLQRSLEIFGMVEQSVKSGNIV